MTGARALAVLGLVVLMATFGFVPSTAAASPAGASSASQAYDTGLSYAVRFFPRWFTYQQSQLQTNRLIAPKKITPLYHAVVAVNDDTLYASGFVDVSSQPTVLTIPSTTVTYSVLVLDPYGNVIPTAIPALTAGTFALTGPGWNGTLPAGVTPVPVPITFMNVIIRADKYAHGQDETTAAAQFRASLRMQSLSKYVTSPQGGSTQILPEAFFAVPFKQIADQEMMNAPLEFLRQLQQGMHSATTPPLPASDQALADQFDAVFADKSAPTQAQLRRAVRAAHDMIISHYLTHTIGGSSWITFTNIGQWGTDFLDRDATTEYIQFGNNHATAAYYHSFTDGAGAALDGSDGRVYSLTFAPGQLPEASRFWSLTAYLPGSIELVPNPADKYLVASYTPQLHTDPDGSVTIYMSRVKPAGVADANWLPAPNGPFNVMLRVYGPQGSVADNTYIPPRIGIRP